METRGVSYPVASARLVRLFVVSACIALATGCSDPVEPRQVESAGLPTFELVQGEAASAPAVEFDDFEIPADSFVVAGRADVAALVFDDGSRSTVGVLDLVSGDHVFSEGAALDASVGFIVTARATDTHLFWLEADPTGVAWMLKVAPIVLDPPGLGDAVVLATDHQGAWALPAMDVSETELFWSRSATSGASPDEPSALMRSAWAQDGAGWSSVEVYARPAADLGALSWTPERIAVVATPRGEGVSSLVVLDAGSFDEKGTRPLPEGWVPDTLVYHDGVYVWSADDGTRRARALATPAVEDSVLSPEPGAVALVSGYAAYSDGSHVFVVDPVTGSVHRLEPLFEDAASSLTDVATAGWSSDRLVVHGVSDVHSGVGGTVKVRVYRF